MSSFKFKLLMPAVVAALAQVTSPALSQPMEKVKVATSFLGNWDTSQPSYCKDRGEFARQALTLKS